MYSSLARLMAPLSLATYAIDVRGLGAWQENDSQDSALDAAACLVDVRCLLKDLRQQYRGVPIFLLGESLGATIAIGTAADAPELVDGLILSSPAWVIYDHKPDMLRLLWSMLLSPGKPVSISWAVFQHAPRVVEWHESDPLIRLQFTAGELLRLAHFFISNTNIASSLTEVPVLVVQGEEDELTRATRTLELFQQIPNPDKELFVIGSAGHLIFQNPQIAPRAVEILRHWIAKRLAKSKADYGAKNPRLKTAG